MKKFIVITTIFPPTPAVKTLARLADWQVVVVGDKKTPDDWSYPGVTYLGLAHQAALDYALVDQLPLNHYARKNVGYLYAIQQGADLIVDLDDDNIPYEYWAESMPSESVELPVVSAPKFANVYKLFTTAFIWPRGFPLNAVSDKSDLQLSEVQLRHIGVCQFLADRDPDVDAIYRLLFNAEVYFERRGYVALERGVYSPFNSQNTLWFKDAFPLMFLPTRVTFRFTDILRGYIAQRCLWAMNRHLAFGPPTTCQERNPHNYMADFQSEIPVYLNTPTLVATLDTVSDVASPLDMLRACYAALLSMSLVDPQEIAACEAWLDDLRKIIVNKDV